MEGLSIEQKDDAVVAAYSGELTLDVTQEVKNKLQEALESCDCKKLVLNLSEVSFIDSSGIGFLVSLSSRLQSSGLEFALMKPSAQVGKTLELVQLKSYFRILDSEDEV
jgi:anti-sigma B factor antagonist